MGSGLPHKAEYFHPVAILVNPLPKKKKKTALIQPQVMVAIGSCWWRFLHKKKAVLEVKH